MTVITIRNVPDELNERLKLRARERGQSLQQFLLRELTEVADRSPLEERLREVLSRRPEVSVASEDIRVALDEARQERDSRLAAVADRAGQPG